MPDETPNNILLKVRNKVEECFQTAEKFYGEKIPRAQISFDLTGKTAGTSCYAKKLLRFNRKLLIDNEQEFMDSVVPHELSHHVCRWKYGYAGIASHGKEWRKISIEIFRLPPKRCHSMDTSKVAKKTREYKITCGCFNKEYSVGIIKFNRMKRNTSVCAKCLQPFNFDGKKSAASIAPKGLKEMELD